MTEEIKEILEDIKNTEECSLSGKNALFLLDYITNLQQEKSDICRNRLAIAIERDRLQQENEKLKETVENLTTMTVCGDKKQIKNTAQYKLDIYKSRCEKAVEYIKEHWVIDEPIKFKNDLLNILNGSDENE